MTKRIAIISSYGEACGAAFYSSRLKAHLEKHAVVDVLRLDGRLLRSTNKKLIAAGDRAIVELAAKMKDYDGICLQLEPGLYASGLSTAYRRLKVLFAAHKNIVVTIHGFYALREYGLVRLAGDIFKLRIKKVMRQALWWHYDRVTVKFWAHVNKHFPEIKIHAFCKGDADYFATYFGCKHTSHYPITYYSRSEVNALKQSATKEQLLKKYNLDPSYKYVSIFGFVGAYKGHLVALKALEYLPENYRLLIVGGEHPHGLPKGMSMSPYMRLIYTFINGNEIAWNHYDSAQSSGAIYLSKDLIDPFADGLIPERPLADRVHFIGQLDDEEMVRFYNAVDYVVHPYVETDSGQSASGPALLALEFGANALYSNARVFRQMEQYFKGAMPFFGVGNYKEMAEAVMRYDNFRDEISANREMVLQEYNPDHMTAHYIKLLGF